MIRMGRSSKSEQPDTTDFQGHTSTPPAQYSYGTEAQASPRVVTDSESIARDIKEGRLSGFVGHGTTLTGETNFQMMLRVDGQLTGSVSSEGGTLIVGTNGQVDANIAVAVATINGEVNGDIIASDKVQLGRTARVIGNIATPRIIIEEGAMFEGSCSMLKSRDAMEKHASEQQKAAEQAAYQRTSSLPAEDETDEFLGTTDDDEDETSEAAAS